MHYLFKAHLKSNVKSRRAKFHRAPSFITHQVSIGIVRHWVLHFASSNNSVSSLRQACTSLHWEPYLVLHNDLSMTNVDPGLYSSTWSLKSITSESTYTWCQCW